VAAFSSSLVRDAIDHVAVETAPGKRTLTWRLHDKRWIRPPALINRRRMIPSGADVVVLQHVGHAPIKRSTIIVGSS
jgi:hypothetical protein